MRSTGRAIIMTCHGLAVACVLSLAFQGEAAAAALTWTGLGGNTNFNTAGNWSPAQIPTAGDSCTINSTSGTQPSITNTSFCGSLTLGTGGTLMTLTYVTSQNLTISGDVTIGANGRLTPSGTPTGVFTIGGNWSDDIGTTNFTSSNLHLTYEFTGTSKTISTDETFYHINIKGNITLASDLSISNTFDMQNGSTFTHGANTITLNSASFIQNGTYNHTCASTLSINGAFGAANGDVFPNLIIGNGASFTGPNFTNVCDLTIDTGGTFDLSGTLSLGGDWIRNTGSTFISGSGEVIMASAGATIGGTIATNWFHKLTIGDGAGDSTTATTHIESLDILTVTAGSTFTLQDSKDITTHKSININGNMYVSGTTTWYKSTGNNIGIKVASGGLLSLQGTDDGNRITLTRIGGAGGSGYWDLVANGGIDMDFVDVYYIQEGGSAQGLALNTPNGQTLGFDNVSINDVEDVNGTHMLYYGSPQSITAVGIDFYKGVLTAANDFNVWANGGGSTVTFLAYGGDFAGEAQDHDDTGTATWTDGLEGTVYTDEGVTNIGSGKTVRLLVNGSSVATDTTDGQGRFAVAAAFSAGDDVLVYIDGDATYKGVTVSESDGNAATGFHIYAAHVIVRDDNAGVLSITEMDNALGAYSDADILFSVSAGDLTVSGAGTELYVLAGESFTPGGNVTTPALENLGTFSGGANTLDVNGDLTLTGGSFTSTSATLTVAGDFTRGAGTFTHNSGTVTLDGTGQTVSGSTTFNNFTKSVASADTLTFAAGSTQTVAGTLTLNGASGQLLSLVSDTPGTAWNLTVQAGASKSVDYLNVTDGDASGSDASHKPINPTNSVDGGGNTAWFGYSISGKVFEDSKFAGAAADYVNETDDKALANVDVELYDNSDVYQSSTTTDANGDFSFAGLSNATYKVRVRSATLADADTTPKGGFNACVPATCSYPLAEMTWGNGSAMYGGQSATTDDTATGDNAGPGDTYVSVTVSGADVTGVNFGFAHNLIVNVEDSGQGSLRQFIANTNAIGAAGSTTANSSEFRMQVATNQTSGGENWWRIAPTTALDTLSDDGTTIDGSTQRTNSASDSNSVGPEIEINGSSGGGAIHGLTLNSNNNVIHEVIVNQFTDQRGINIIGGSGNTITGSYVGTNALASAANANSQGIYNDIGASGTIIGTASAGNRNIISGNTFYGLLDVATGGMVIKNNYVGTDRTGTAAIPNGASGGGLRLQGDGNTVGGSGANEGNLISGNTNMGLVLDSSSNNTVYGNLIGTQANGVDALANGSDGLQLTNGSASNTIGGTGAGEANTIAHNGAAGINVVGAATDNNVLSANSIFENTGLGIDLDGAGANNDQAAPSISSVTSDGTDYTVVATLTAGDTIEFFRVNNSAAPTVTADGSGAGEGYLFLGTCVDNGGACSGPHISAVADADPAAGTVQATLLTTGLSLGDQVTATTTDATDGTSEFASNNQYTLQIVKQTWDPGTSTCLASSPAEGGCNGGASSITVPTGKTVYFLIFIRNDTGSTASDIRIQDLLDDTAFTYVANSIERTLNDGSAGQPDDNATIAAIFAAATIAETDAFDAELGAERYAGVDTAATPDDLLLGGDGTAGNNDTVNIPANKSFAIRFQAVKN